MERTSFSLLFYIRRTKLNKFGEAPIFMRLTVNGNRSDASVKRFIAPRLWNSSKGKATEKGLGCRDLNLYLDAISSNILRILRDMELAGEELSARSILDRYLGKNLPERWTLVEVFRAHNEKCRKLSGIDYAPATVSRYETCLKLLCNFLSVHYQKEDFYLNELPQDFIEEFELYLKTNRKCGHNTTIKYLANFKKITRLSLARGWLNKDPFSEYKFHLKPVERDFLEWHELQRLKDKHIDIPRMAQIRDIFVFCCFTGLAFSDVKQLRPEHIVLDINGARWIRKSRQKTQNMCNIPLLDAANEILSRYADNDYCQKRGVLLPVCSNQKMNLYLKELADICGIRKHLSTHCSRHFQSSFLLRTNDLQRIAA